MSFLTRYFAEKSKQSAKIAVIGPSRSGKTTFIRFLETGETVEDLPTTIGIEIRKEIKPLGNWEFVTYDTGGQKVFQQVFWELSIQEADIVIFVIDATLRPETAPNKFASAKEQFNYASDIISKSQLLLILINKQDLHDQNPLSAKELMQLFKIQMIENSIGLIETAVKFGTGVPEAIQWIIQKLER